MAKESKNQGFLGQLIRFICVGGVSACVDYGLLMLGMHYGIPHNYAKVLSWIAGTSTAYMLNQRYTFAATASKKIFAAVMSLYATTFIVQVGIFAMIFPALLHADLSEVWAGTIGFIIAQSIATITNFLAQRYVIFKS
ncbi:MAG: GtrA family protein [Propionibacteriaceae bacterium]